MRKHVSLKTEKKPKPIVKPVWSPKEVAKTIVREALCEVIDELLVASEQKKVETAALRESLLKVDGSKDLNPVLDSINNKLDGLTANVTLEHEVLERLKAKLSG